MYLILHYLERYKTYVFFNILAILGFAAVELGVPTIVSRVVDNGIALNDRAYIYKMEAAILAMAIAGGVGNVLLTCCSSQAGTRITRGIRNSILRKTQELSHTEYDEFGISSMIARATNDTFILMQFINIILRTALLTPIMIIISMFVVIRTSMTLSMVIGGCIPVICLDVYLVARASNPISTKQQRGLNRPNRIIRENLTGVRVIHAFCKDEYETECFFDADKDCVKNVRKLFKLMSVTQPSLFLLLNLAVSVVFILSSRLTDVDSLQMGNLVAFQEHMFHAMFSMILFFPVFVMYPRVEISARRIKKLLDEQPLIQNPKDPVLSGDESGTLIFDHVSFQCPGGEAPVLRDITFKVGRGDTVAFVGSTGSEKSTLINLIPRLYDISSGNIRINNVNMHKYNLEALRERIGFIPQKALPFIGNITENTRYGKHDAMRFEVRHSTKVAQAYDFIAEEPHQFDEMIEEGGGNVFGGQYQRLSIAGAVVRRPDTYIFGNSFSALDFKTDANLRKKLKEETKGAITSIVAQRVISIMDATKVVILNKGAAVGMGAHRELLRSYSIYHGITTSQLSEEELVQ